MTDIVERLREIEALKPGERLPDWAGPVEGIAFSKMCGSAADEIVKLRDQLQRVFGIAERATTGWQESSADLGQSFADIKKGIRNG